MNVMSRGAARRLPAIMLGLFAVIGCGSRTEQAGASGATSKVVSTAAATDSATRMASMPGMSGMSTSSAMMSAAAMDSMRAEMARMRTMSADQMKAAMPMHRQMTANMLSQMNADMRSMNMAADPAWDALVDSLRRDLVALPDIPTSRLTAALAPHFARVDRLMTMHAQMMKTSK